MIWRTHREVLRASTANLLTPNLRLVAKHDPRESDDEVCKLIGLVLALTVQVRSVALRYLLATAALSQAKEQCTEIKPLLHHAHSHPRSRSTLPGSRNSTNGSSAS